MEIRIGMNEGDRCNRVTTGNPGGLFDGKPCIGDMHVPPVEGCACHISPPCSACVDNAIECDVCGAVAEDE